MILLSAFRGEGGASGNLLQARFLRSEGAGFSRPRALPRMRHSRGGVNETNSSFRPVVFDRAAGGRDRACGSDTNRGCVAGRIAESAAETSAGGGDRDAHRAAA